MTTPQTVNNTNVNNRLKNGHSNYSIFKRIGNMVLVIVFSIVCVNLWLLSQDEADNWYTKQAGQLGRSIAAYSAKVIALQLQPADKIDLNAQEIKNQLELIASDPHVLGVSLFGTKGQIIDTTEGNISVLANFLIEEDAPLVFVEEIILDGKILGYLRLLLDEERIMLYHDDYQRHLYEQLSVMMLLAGLAGILVARVYYKVRFRNYSKSKS